MAVGLYPPDPNYVRPGAEPDVFARLPAMPAVGPTMADMAATVSRIQPYRSSIQLPYDVPEPDIHVNQATQQIMVQGHVFDADDADMALQTESLLNQPGTGDEPGGGWQRLSPATYGQFLNSIKNPSLGRLAKKNFGMGIDIQQQLLGQGLQFLGAEQTGKRLVDQQTEDLRKTSPYNRNFTDIGSADNQGPIDWLVANFAQQGPNLIESIATGMGGYAAGAALGGTRVSQAGQMLAKMSANTQWKAGVTAALERRLAGAAALEGDTKLLKEAAGLAGAVAASAVQNVGTGVADIYGETRQAGAGPDDNTARLKALAGSAPYGLLELLPEYALASRVLNPGNYTRKLAGLSLGGKALEIGRRAAVGTAVGGALEGTTEAGQEGLLLAANPNVDWDSPQGINRLVNSFAAGFGIGGPLGGLANLRGGEPANVLNPGDTNNPVAPPTTPPPGTMEDMFGGPTRAPGQNQMPVLPGDTSQIPPAIPPATEPFNPAQGTFDFGGQQLDMFGGAARNVPNQMPVLPGDVSQIPPAVAPATGMAPGQLAMNFAAPGEQLGMFGPPGPTTANQMPILPGDASPISFGVPPATQPVNPMQGALQFAPPAPAGPGFGAPVGNLGEQLQAAQQTAIADQAYNQRGAEQTTFAQRLRDLGHARMAGAQELATIPTPIDETMASMPMQDIPARTPQQLSLFRRGQAPRSTGMERLARGVRPLTKAAATIAEQIAERDALFQERAVLERAIEMKGAKFTRGRIETARQRIKAINARLEQLPPVSPSDTGQLGLFTSSGAPSMAALKGAGKRQQYRPEPAKETKPKKPKKKGLRGLKRQAGVVSETKITETPPTLPTTAPPVTIEPAKGKAALTAKETLRREVEAARASVEAELAAAKAKEEADALQERSTAKVSTREAPGDRGTVGQGVSVAGQAPGAQNLRRKKAPSAAPAAGETKTVQTKVADPYKVAEDKLYDMKVDPNTTKREVLVYVKKLKDDGLIDTDAMNEAQRIAKDRDMEAEDIIDDLVSTVRITGERVNAIKASVAKAAVVKGATATGPKSQAAAVVSPAAAASQENIPSGQVKTEGLPPTTAPSPEEAARAAASKTVPTRKAAIEALTPQPVRMFMNASETTPPNKIEDSSTKPGKKGRTYIDSGKPVTGPMGHGRVRMAVRQFVSKLYAKPLVHVYRNQADFKAQNPQAYARAVEEYPHKDFDTSNASGYSFGREIAIFTDRVYTPQQLNFIMAHESLGHYGFRALMPEAELHAALNMIYDQSPHIKSVADIYMASRPELTKAEAVEEYLADHAAVLENNVLQRFWNAIKNFFKGANFQDDMARYLISQARAYVRHGKTYGHFTDFRAIAQKWLDYETIQQPLKMGRMFTEALEYGEANRMAMDSVRHVKYTDNVEKLKAELEKKGINIADGWRKLLTNLKTMNYAARENLGFRRLYDILLDTVHTASFLRATYNDMMSTVLQPSIELAGHQFSRGATQAQIGTTGDMLKATALKKSLTLTDNKLRKLGALYNIVDGEAVRNHEAITKMKEMGRISLKEFQDGFEYTAYTASPITEEDKAQIEKDRAKALEGITDPKSIKDINAEHDDLKKSDTYMRPRTVTFPAMPKLTKDSLEYKMYLEVRDTIDEAALNLLEANFEAVKGERDNILRSVSRFLGKTLTAEDEKAVENVKTQYMTLRNEDRTVTDDGEIHFKQESLDKANAFMAKFNEVMLAHETDKDPQLKKFLSDKEYDDVSKDIATLRKDAHIARDKPRKFKMQQAVQNIAMFEAGRDDAHMFAKRTIAGGYVPFGRSGAWQVRVNAVDPTTGQIYKVHELYRDSLVYLQTDHKADSVVSARAINRAFEHGNEEGSFRLKVLDDDNQWRVKVVKLEARAETAREDAPAGRETNLNELIHTLSQLSIDLTPTEREKLVTRLTQQNHRARTRLRRTGSPGEDPNTIKYVSQHLEATASIVARKKNRHHLDRLFDEEDGTSQRLWKGDQVRYDELKKAWEDAQKNPALSDQQKQAAKMAFIDYNFTYKVKDAPTYGQKYINDGNKLLAFLDTQKDVEHSDYGSSATMSKARQYLTFAMLGASPATALLNFISLGTNVVPALAGYNQNNGFGGGFGWARSATEMSRAINMVKDDKQSDVKYWKALLDDESDKLLDKAGFTRTEAEFMRNQVGGGTMQAAQTNALIGAMRSQLKSGLQQQLAKKWMFLFNYSEQVARRSTGLATFRMALARELEVRGVAALPLRSEERATAEAEAFAAAQRFAVNMIDDTLGQYATFNRPALFRGGFGQFIFIYKMFAINSIQMLKNLPRMEQMLALGILMAFSGIKGLPFFDDFMDILDTIAQALGFKPGRLWHGSAEKTLADFLNWISPGMTPTMLRGFVVQWLPANISDRTSLSNIIPGSGIGLAKADVGRELVEIGGPMASFAQGAAKFVGNAARTIAEPSKAGVIHTLRDQPITMLRAAADSWAYSNAGAIVNQKGYVVSRDLNAGTYAARMLGFYPTAAMRENDVVKMSTRISNYRKDIAAQYYSEYISAKLSHDQNAVNNVLDHVADWNDAAKGTGLELTNFRRSAERALKEANRTTTERYLRTIPKNTRAEVQHMRDMLIPEEDQQAAGD